MTVTPNPKTALLIDAIVRQLDQVDNRSDILLASAEFGMGAPDIARPIDLAFGFVPLQSSGIVSAGPARDPISLSKGLVRLGIALDPEQVTVHQQTLYPIDTSTPVALDDLSSVLGSKSVQDVYLFGSVVLISSVSTSSSGSTVTATKTASLHTRWARGGSNGTGAVLQIRRDFSLDDALDCLKTGAVSVYTGDITMPFLTILRFVLSVDNYDPADSDKTRVSATLILDERRVRGWGGFCEEHMAAELLPALVDATDQADKQSVVLGNSLKSFITVWVTLDWLPDFETYWNGSPPFSLPERLKTYINENFDLTLT